MFTGYLKSDIVIIIDKLILLYQLVIIERKGKTVSTVFLRWVKSKLLGTLTAEKAEFLWLN